MLLHYLRKLKIQIFCKYSVDMEKCKQFAFLSLLTLLFIHKFWYFRCLIFRIRIANNIFGVTVFFYLFTFRSVCSCRNSSQQTSLQCLSTINMAFSYEDQILIKTQIHSTYTVMHVEELKSVHWKCSFFAFFQYLLNICREFEFLISQGSVATCLRWGG